MARIKAERELTFTERARREQIIGCAIELVAEVGAAGASLSRIAERAGISKAAVLYHFGSKDEIMHLALSSVLEQLVASVGAEVDQAQDAIGAIEAYLRSMVAYIQANPTHLRIMTDAIAAEQLTGGASATESAGNMRTGRWQAVAGMLAAGQQAGEFRDFDPRTVAIWIGGALDGLVGEWLEDRSFDLDAAVEELIRGVRLAIAR